MKNGIISLLLLGIVAVLLLLGIFIFGPWELSGFGQLSQRQGEQAASAAEIAFPGPDDADKDGFKDSVEKWIKTDPADNCADDARDAAWPPDLNNDKKVDQTDTDAFKPYMFKRVKDSNRRFDLNTDKQINIIDVNLLRQYYGKSCPYYFLGGSPAVHEVKLNWAPGLQLISKNVYTQIRYGDMTQAQTTECSNTNSALTGSNAGTLISSDFGIKSSPALQEGQTSYNWNSNTSNYTPIPGHTYCIFIMQSDEQRTTSNVVSNFVEVTLPAPSPLPTSDNDNDGFANKIEEYIGTDPNDNCADSATDAAWPPDFNNDKVVNQADIDAINVYFATKLGDANYDKRFDLNADQVINLTDTYVLRNYNGKSCTP